MEEPTRRVGYPTVMSDQYEVIVVGAGPCGIAVGGAAKKAGLSCVLIDKGCITSSLVDYPYYMTFFSTAVMLEVGGVPFTIANSKPTRREAPTYYRTVVQHWDLDVRQYEVLIEHGGASGACTVAMRPADAAPSTRTPSTPNAGSREAMYLASARPKTTTSMARDWKRSGSR